MTLEWDYFYSQGYQKIKTDSQLFDYFDLFGGSSSDYLHYVENEMTQGEPVSLSFTLAYDFDACLKVWDAFYINLSGGILGVDSDSQGNFVVAGYDANNIEYIIRHSVNGDLPNVWKQNSAETGGKILPGGINFCLND